MDLFKQCCSLSIKKRRCHSIFDKYSRMNKKKAAANNKNGNSRSSSSAVDFEKLCHVCTIEVYNLNENDAVVKKEQVLLESHAKIRATLIKKLNSVFFRSRRFLEYVQALRTQLSSPRSGRNNRFEWSLPCDTAKTNRDGYRAGSAMTAATAATATKATKATKATTAASSSLNAGYGVYYETVLVEREEKSDDSKCSDYDRNGSELSESTVSSCGSMSTETSSLSSGSFSLNLDFSSLRK